MLPGQAAQHFQPFFAQLGPVENILGKFAVANAIIPVAAKDHAAVGHGPVKGEIGTGALAHQIAQTPYLVRPDQSKVTFQRLHSGPVAVQIGNEGDLHAPTS